MNTMKQTYTWGGVDELIMLGMLAQINVSLIDASNTDPSNWVITEVYNEASFGILNDPIFEGKSLIVLFHSINYSGSGSNHYDAIYKFQ